MQIQTKRELSKRSKSFLWRLGAMLVAVTIDFVLVNMGVINIPTDMTIILGLVLGEVSKALHNYSNKKYGV